MQLKDKFFFSLMGTLTFCALIFTGLIVWNSFIAPQGQTNSLPNLREISNWQTLDLQGKRVGPADAPVQIIEFFDYQCPYCKRAQPTLQSIKTKYPQRVSVVYENFPLPNHQYTFNAAVAAECARKQGKFTSYYDLLFENQDQLATISYDSLANEVTINDTEAFSRCVENKETAEIITAGEKLAQQLNINGIPTFIINSTLVSGTLTEQQLDHHIQNALAEAKEN